MVAYFGQWVDAVDERDTMQDMKLDTLSADVREVRASVAQLDRNFEDFKVLVRGRFDQVDQHLISIDKRLDRVDTRFDTIDKRLDGHDSRFDKVDARFDAIDKRLDGHDSRFDHLESMITRVLTLLGDKPAA